MSGHIHITPNAPKMDTFIIMFILLVILYMMLSSCKETYYLRVEEIRADYTSVKGEWMFEEVIVFHTEYYTEIVDFDNDSLIKEGYKPVRALNYKRAYKKYYNGTYIASFPIPK